jgi:hypothetical protein
VKDLKTCKFARGRSRVGVHVTDVMGQPFRHIVQEPIEFRCLGFGHYLDSAIRQVADISGNVVVASNRSCRVAEANPMHVARVVDFTALEGCPRHENQYTFPECVRLALTLNRPFPSLPDMMGRNIHHRLALLLGCMAWALSAACGGETGQVKGAGEGILLLRNGSILRGEVTRQADIWHVRLDRGEIHVPVEQVERGFESLHAAYLYRRSTRIDRSANAHLRLAKWCLRYDLLDEAASELADSSAIDPRLPGIGMMQRQLAQKIKIDSDLSIQDVERMHESVEKTICQPVEPPDLVISKAARIAFVRQIEPMLLRHCATAGCHQPNSKHSFQLNRLAMVGRGHPRLTECNLASVLAQIGKPRFSHDPLVSRAKAAHGAAPIAEISSQSKSLSPRQLQLLEHWLAALDETGRSDGRQADSSAGINSAHMFNAREAWITADHSMPSKAEQMSPSTIDSHPKAPQRGSRLAKFEPRDPFDPRIFNSPEAGSGPAAPDSEVAEE